MNIRLQQFLSAEDISQSQFADSIGVTRASVSHILSGRNNPGYDFLSSMAKRYPTLNTDWLLTGRGKMYRTPDASEPAAIPPAAQTPANDDDLLFGDISAEDSPAAAEVIEPIKAIQEVKPDNTAINQIVSNSTTQRSATKLMVFYNDGTYKEVAL